jgi:hypothetical protein
MVGRAVGEDVVGKVFEGLDEDTDNTDASAPVEGVAVVG